MQIGDCITFHPRAPFADSAEADLKTIRDTFVLTTETGEILARILERLASHPQPQPGAFLFTGNAGVGKTHLLRCLEHLLDAPGDSLWSDLEPYLRNGARPGSRLKGELLNLPEDPAVEMGSFLTGHLNDGGGSVQNSEEFSASMVRAGASRVARGVAFIALENISSRMDRVTDAGQMRQEIQLYRIFAKSLAGSGILVFLVAEERHLKAVHGSASPLSELGDCCDFIWISRNNVAEIIATSIATKDEDQRRDVRRILDRILVKLPALGVQPDTFVSLYPIHPHTFLSLFQLRTILPQFSPLRFAQVAIDAVCARRAEELVTQDFLFDYILPDLRKCAANGPLLAAYDEFLTKVVPEFKTSVQPRVAALLKGIAFSSICENRAATVRALANAFPTVEETDFLPSYNVVLALLMEMEQRGKDHFLVEGEKLGHSLRLVASGGQPIRKSRDRQAEQVLQERAPFLLYEWLNSEIPAWMPDFSAKYRRASQSLTVPVPQGEQRPVGMVYLKSVSDPLWTKDDAAVLGESSYPWILLVLSPFERFYEFDPMLTELAARSPRIGVWRPAAPSAEESERMRTLIMLDDQSAVAELYELLRALYIGRGQFISSGGRRLIADEIENRTLAAYMSTQLLEIAAISGLEGALQEAGESGSSRIRSVEWAALLAGWDTGTGVDMQSAEERLRNWCSTTFEIDCGALSTKLHALPEPLLTTRISKEVKAFETHFERLKPVINRFCKGEVPFAEAVTQVVRNFNGDPGRLSAWKKSMESLSGLLRWAPAFEYARGYVVRAFPTCHEELDQERESLLDAVEQPHAFLDAAAREEFDRRFLKFKKDYIDQYHSLHEDALEIVRPGEAQSKINSVALRNLEVLSNLHYTDKGYLNRVRIIAKWLEHNRCNLPVREILEHSPRCYCNFNPGINRQWRDSATEINTLIQEGLDYFRAVLRKFKKTIIEELKLLRVDDAKSRQVIALISNAPLGALQPASVETLNKIIEKHSSDFLTAVRTTRK